MEICRAIASGLARLPSIMLTLLFVLTTAAQAAVPSRIATCDGMLATLGSTPATPIHVGIREAIDIAKTVHPPPMPNFYEEGMEHLDVYFDLAWMRSRSYFTAHHHRLIARLEQIEADATGASADSSVIAREFRGPETHDLFEKFRGRVETLDRVIEDRASGGPLTSAARGVLRFLMGQLISTGGWTEHVANVEKHLRDGGEAFSVLSGSIAIDPATLSLISSREGRAPTENDLARMREWIDEQASAREVSAGLRDRLFYDSIFFTDAAGEPVWLLVVRRAKQTGSVRRRKPKVERPSVDVLAPFRPAPEPALIPIRVR